MHDRQFCEVLMTVQKASLLHRDRREPRQLMTLAVRNEDEQEEDSGLDEDEQPTEHQRLTKTQIKMVNQYHQNLGSIEARVFESVKGSSCKTCSALEYVRCDLCRLRSTRDHSLLERLQSQATSLISSLLWTCSTLHADFEHHSSWHEFPGATSCDKTGTTAVVWSTFGTPDVMHLDRMVSVKDMGVVKDLLEGPRN